MGGPFETVEDALEALGYAICKSCGFVWDLSESGLNEDDCDRCRDDRTGGE